MRGGSLAGPSTMMNGEFGGNYRSGGDRRGYRDVGVNGDMGYRTTGGGLAYPGGYRGGDMVRAGGYRGGSLARYGGGGIGRYGGGGYRHGHDNWRRIDGGNALKTFSFEGPVEAVQVDLLSEGRPIEADVELWQGPNNIPIKMKVHSDDGDRHPMSVVMDTPGTPNTIAVRNTAPQEFPIEACVTASSYRPHFVEPPVEVQGGALRTFELNPYVERVAIMLETDGRPLNATIELMRGPNYQSQVVEVYADDGLYRPVFLVFDVPMHGCAVRVINTASLEFPITAWVEPYGGGGGRGYGGGYGRGVRGKNYYNQLRALPRRVSASAEVAADEATELKNQIAGLRRKLGSRGVSPRRHGSGAGRYRNGGQFKMHAEIGTCETKRIFLSLISHLYFF